LPSLHEGTLETIFINLSQKPQKILIFLGKKVKMQEKIRQKSTKLIEI